MKKDEGLFVVKATAFKVKDQIISKAMTKMDADAFAERLIANMEDITPEFRAFDDIKVTKYKPEPLYLNKEQAKKGSILDALGDKIN